MGAQRNVVVELARAETQAGPRGREDRAAARDRRAARQAAGLCAQRADDDPYINPIKLLALDLLRRMQAEEIDAPTVEALIQRLTREAFARAPRPCAPTWASSTQAATRPASRPCCAPRPAARTASSGRSRSSRRPAPDRLWLRVHGTSDLQPFGRAAGDPGLAAIGADGRGSPRRPRRAEHSWRGRAPAAPAAGPARPRRGARAVDPGDPPGPRPIVREVYEVAFDVARELYPDDWRKLRPRLVTLATWVGYDTDGRADIGWTVDLRQAADGAARPAHATTARWPQACLRASRRRAAAGAAAGAARGAAGARDQVGRGRSGGAGRARQPGCRTGASGWRGPPATWSASRGTPADRTPIRCSIWSTARWRRSRTTRWRCELCVLRAELATQGLVGAGTHVRINAIQLHNAIRKTIGMDHAPDDPTHRLTYVNAIARLIDGAEPRDHQLRLGHRRAGDRAAHVHDRGADAQAPGRQRADPLPDRRVRDVVHDPDRALLRQPVRRSRTGSTSRRCSRPARRWSAAPRSSRARWPCRPIATICAAAAASASRPASPTPAATWASPRPAR